MKDKLLNWLNGALGQKKDIEIPKEDQFCLEDGIIKIPDFFGMTPDPYGEIYIGPECEVSVDTGDRVAGGTLLAEIVTSGYIFELTAPCNAVIEEVYLVNGQVVEPGQKLCKIREL